MVTKKKKETKRGERHSLAIQVKESPPLLPHTVARKGENKKELPVLRISAFCRRWI